jgi:hypothetical protein
LISSKLLDAKKKRPQETFDDSNSDEYEYDNAPAPVKGKGKKAVIDVAENFHQRKVKKTNIIGAKMRCDENGCNPVVDSDEIFSQEESGSL